MSSISPGGPRVSQLSGGEERRLDFATAVYGRPELIFRDEPTIGLDIQSRDVGGRAAAPRGRRRHRADNALSGGGPTAGRPDRTDAPRRSAPRRDGLRAHPRTAGSLRFSLAQQAPVPPPAAMSSADGTYVIATLTPRADLKNLLDWSSARGVELVGLSAAPTRLDDVFRTIGAPPRDHRRRRFHAYHRR